MGIILVDDVTDESIPLSLAWSHLSLDPEGSPPETPHDDWIKAVGIPAARESCEDFTGLALAPKRYMVSLDAFPVGAIELDYPPVIGIVSVKYADESGVEQVMDPSDYMLDPMQIDPWLLSTSGSWPATAPVANAVKITFDVGYDKSTLPAVLRAAMLLTTGNLFKNRESVTGQQSYALPLGVEYLLRPRRRRRGLA